MLFCLLRGQHTGICRTSGRCLFSLVPLESRIRRDGRQVHELEKSLGFALLKPSGRGVFLTETGMAAMRLAIGVSDSLPKPATRKRLQPIIGVPSLRLLRHEDEFERLQGDLAVHQLDMVLSDRPAPTNPNIKL